MTNYKDGKIYRLVSKTTGSQYVGSTTQPLSKRLHGHKRDYDRWKGGYTGKGYVSSFRLFEEGEVEVFLLEDYSCDRKEQLHARERHWVENTECVNRHVPTRTAKEWREANKEHLAELQKQYTEKNRESVKSKNKEYYHQHRDALYEKQKQRRKANADKWSDYNKQYYQTNREKVLEKGKERVNCGCGSELRKPDLARHLRSKKHQEWLTTQSSDTTSSSNPEKTL